MAKIEIKLNTIYNQIFDDLEKYLDFCKTYGYTFDETELYSTKSYNYRQYTKYIAGKAVKDNWELDGKPE